MRKEYARRAVVDHRHGAADHYALQIKSREEFIVQLTSNLPARPEYFAKDAEINRAGAAALSDLPPLRALAPSELKTMLDDGEIALDIRSGDEFAAGHVPGSVNIALSGQFASWAGTVLGLTAHPVLIAASRRAKSKRRGCGWRGSASKRWTDFSVAAWRRGRMAGFPLGTIAEMNAEALAARMRSHDVQVLDVRRAPEWEAGHIEGAIWWPLDNFKISPPEMDRHAEVAVHCKGGYRSMIASSLLQRAGFKNVINVTGGFDAWQHANLAVVSAKPVGV